MIFITIKFINLKKIFAVLCTVITVMSCAVFAPAYVLPEGASVITASAASSVCKPKLTAANMYSNKIEMKISNLNSYPDNSTFYIMVNGRKVKSYKYKTLKNKNLISIFDDGKNYLKGSTNYTVSVYAISGKKTSSTATMKVKTGSFTYYKVNSKVQLYTLSNGKFKTAGKTSNVTYAKGVLCDNKGKTITGRDKTSCKDDYLKINKGDYKGKYVKTNAGIQRVTERTAKVQKVVQYAIGMNGGRYVYGGARYRACDCTGLTMLAYQQVGINISHSTRTQATMGKTSSMKNLKAGDIIICNNYGHAALYIGDGKIIHAMNSYYGIRIQDVSKISYCGRVNTVRTII